MPSCTADEFLSRLASRAVPAKMPLGIHGLVQPNADDAATLLFSGSPGCREWIALPLVPG